MNNPEVDVGGEGSQHSAAASKLSVVGGVGHVKQLQVGSLSKRQASSKENNSTGLLSNMHGSGASFHQGEPHMKVNSTSSGGPKYARVEALRAAHKAQQQAAMSGGSNRNPSFHAANSTARMVNHPALATTQVSRDGPGSAISTTLAHPHLHQKSSGNIESLSK